MYIVKASEEPKDNRSHTHLQAGQTLLILKAEDLNSDGDRFRGQAPDVVMIPKEFEKVYIHCPAWKALAPCIRRRTSLKFY